MEVFVHVPDVARHESLELVGEIRLGLGSFLLVLGLHVFLLRPLADIGKELVGDGELGKELFERRILAL